MLIFKNQTYGSISLLVSLDFFLLNWPIEAKFIKIYLRLCDKCRKTIVI